MRFSIESFGCTMNHGEAELLRRRLVNSGNLRTSSDDADVNIIFTCVVIQETEKRMLKKIGELEKLGKPMVISGCLVTAYPERAREIAPDALLVAPREVEHLRGKTIENWLHGNEIMFHGKEFKSQEEMASHGAGRNGAPGLGYGNCELFSDPSLENLDRSTFIVPISQGCLGDCAYCITKHARGMLQSYPPENIVNLTRAAVDAGLKEIQLTSQDTGIYGRDMGTSLPQFLHQLSDIPGDFRIRVGMMNPRGMKRIIEELIDVYSSERVFKFLHMPIQSGDDEILKRMNRKYTVLDAVNILERFREAIPELTFSTDIITGFPGEDDESFSKTLKLVEEIAPDLVNITRYSERPGTHAISLDNKVHGGISKERSRELTKLRFRISKEKNARHVGKTMRVLVTESGKSKGKGSSVICRDDFYRLVVIRERLPMGEWYDVAIVDSTDVYLLGELI